MSETKHTPWGHDARVETSERFSPEARSRRIVEQIRRGLLVLGAKEGDVLLRVIELAYEPILAEFKEAIRKAREVEAALGGKAE